MSSKRQHKTTQVNNKVLQTSKEKKPLNNNTTANQTPTKFKLISTQLQKVLQNWVCLRRDGRISFALGCVTYDWRAVRAPAPTGGDRGERDKWAPQGCVLCPRLTRARRLPTPWAHLATPRRRASCSASVAMATKGGAGAGGCCVSDRWCEHEARRGNEEKA